jgi:uncharacterized protein involved in outer membrane biogenesis
MRTLLIGLGVVAGLVVVAALLAWNSLDLIVRAAFEHWGPDLTGGKVEVKEVQISPRDGRGRIAGLDIGNPPGFSAPRAARFGEIRLAVDPATLTDDVIVIRELAVESAQITYERADKSTNLDAIQKRIDAYAKASDPTGEARGEARAKKRRFVIERLSIRKTRVTMTNKGLGGQGLAFDLPDVELRDVGRRQDGVTASQAAAIVASTLQQRIALKVLTNVEALRRGGLEGAVDALKGLVK